VHGALLVAADVHHPTGLSAVDYDGRFRLRALRFFDRAVLSVIQDIRLTAVRLPAGNVGNAEWLLTFRFERFHPNLHEGFDFRDSSPGR
jgi:hypothetical protein